MSRERRRKGSTRKRRRSAALSSGRGRSIPTAPVVAAAGVVAVAALIGYLIWQVTNEPLSGLVKAAEVERDPAPDLPGEHVNLPELYADERGPATYRSNGSVPNTAKHVAADVDYEAAGNSNPPAGGPMWSGDCGRDAESSPDVCGPAPWGVFRTPWRPETLNHNMEHGGVVIWYNTADQEIIDDLEDFVEDLFPVVLTPYPDMEDEYVAVTTWGRIDKFPVSEYTRERLEEFNDAHNCHFRPEGMSDC